jgi:Flp pilus assembly protein TadG
MKSLRINNGLAAIEMLFVLPILLLLLVGIFEIGRIFIHYTTLNKALQHGVRSAVIETYGTERLSSIANEEYIKNIIVYGTVTSVGVSILPDFDAEDITVDTSSTEGYVTISADYGYKPVFTSVPFFGDKVELNIHASSLMRTSP